MDRLRFLKILGMWTAALAGRQLIAAEPASPAQQLPAQHDDFVIVRRSPQSHLPNLESLLAIPPRKPLRKNHKIIVERYPEVIYHCDFQWDGNAGSKWDACALYGGSALLLNRSGFFISAHHLFTDHLTEKNQENNKCTMLLYDPASNIFTEAFPLIYSKRYDLLLGRVNLPPNARVTKTFISPTDEPPLHYVYTTIFADPGYIKKDLFVNIISAGEPGFTLRNGKRRFQFTQTRHVQNGGLGSLNMVVSCGELKDIKEQYKELVDGQYSFVSTTAKGNSGSPIFDVHSNLMGVLSKGGEDLLDQPTGKNYNVGIYTGPLAMRRMIQAYINACA